MSIIKLNKVVYSKDTNKQGYFYPTGTEEILFNTDMIIKVSVGESYTRVQYKEALTNAFECIESLDDILNLIKG